MKNTLSVLAILYAMVEGYFAYKTGNINTSNLATVAAAGGGGLWVLISENWAKLSSYFKNINFTEVSVALSQDDEQLKDIQSIRRLKKRCLKIQDEAIREQMLMSLDLLWANIDDFHDELDGVKNEK